MNYLRLLLILAVIFHASSVWAASCTAVFPSTVTSNVSGGLNLSGIQWVSGSVLGAQNRELGVGSFYFNGGSTPTGGWTLRPTGGASTRVFVNGSLTLNNNAQLNAGGDAQDLILIVNGSLHLGNNVTINAFVHVSGSVSFGNNLAFDGAITSRGVANSPGGNSSLVYNSGALALADFASLCGSEDRQMYLRFDEASWSGVAGEVRDSSGSGNAGVAMERAQTSQLYPKWAGNPGTCRYGVFDGSQHVSVQNDSTLSFSDVLSVGMWVRPTQTPARNVTLIGKGNNYKLELSSSGHVVLSASMQYGVWPLNGTEGLVLNSSVPLPLDKWTFVAFTLQSVQREWWEGDFRDYLVGNLYVGTDVVQRQTNSRWLGKPVTNASLVTIGGAGASGFSGYIDEVRLDQKLLNAENFADQAESVHPCPGSASIVDHYRIDHPSNGLTCSPLEVTLRACRDADCQSNHLGANVTLSPTGWVNPSSDLSSGEAEAQLRVHKASVVTLGVASANPDSLHGVRCFSEGVEGTCQVAFYDSGFVFSNLSPIVAGKPQRVGIQAVKKDDETQTCAPAFKKGEIRTLQFNAAYVEPDSGSRTLSVGRATLIPGAGRLGASADVSLEFDEHAKAGIDVTYYDAGRILLNARYVGTGVEDGLDMRTLGPSSFVSRPFGLCLQTNSLPGDDYSATSSLFPGNVRAGDSFDLTIKPVVWTAASATGTPLQAGNICGNTVTPNYQQSGIALSSLELNGGFPGKLEVENHDHPLGGATDIGQSVSEVGVFQLTATPPAYLGTDMSHAVSQSGRVGRFIPAKFLFSDPTLIPACTTGFSYAGVQAQVGASKTPAKDGQPFKFFGSLAAVNRAGEVTANYIASFAKLTARDIAFDDSAATPVGTVVVEGIDLIVPGSGGAGYVDFTATRPHWVFNVPSAPYELTIRTSATDSDGVSGSGVDVQSSNVRLGQAAIINAHGSEVQNLPIPFRASYFNGSGYVLNDLDSCTSFGSAVLGEYIRDSTGTGLPRLETRSYVASGGQGKYLLTAPGNASGGSVWLTLTPTPRWLQFDWDGDGVLDDARGLATFGIYKGPKPLIFRREIYGQ